MAICFELVVNFGDNVEAAQAAAALTEPHPYTLQAGAHSIPFHRPMLRPSGRYIELAFMPVGVGWRAAIDRGLPGFALTAAELTELGHQLYGLLVKFHGYTAAMVGWDPEHVLDPVELPDYELNDNPVPGLVLCEELHNQLGLGPDYLEFQPGYRWIPYQGETRALVHRPS
ncbi:hypothetical protein [Streptacidiphilus sp. P02-A3a]|uniref:hypothetical protein n=1 Tax=Streptacidiphilus sp. P02-A3a TaxID=2704468 RepID=UPI0015F8841F|nr:hypothetical protein [Streptacidiphilus sp. P02-A3a]QMU69917.1 hypothetical protein GXP74_18525 [Streptacidiphilus sp. P02-A3a]